MSQHLGISLTSRNRIIGQKFGRLEVIDATDKRSSKGDILYKCLCLCGQTKLTTKSRLLDGRVVSCGCKHSENSRAMCKARFFDLSGSIFGRLRVMHRSETTHAGQLTYLCWCECGMVTKVQASNLKNGSAQSCGCLARQAASLRWKNEWKNNRKTMMENCIKGRTLKN